MACGWSSRFLSSLVVAAEIQKYHRPRRTWHTESLLAWPLGASAAAIRPPSQRTKLRRMAGATLVCFRATLEVAARRDRQNLWHRRPSPQSASHRPNQEPHHQHRPQSQTESRTCRYWTSSCVKTARIDSTRTVILSNNDILAGTCSCHAWLPIPAIISLLPWNNKSLKICPILSWNLSIRGSSGVWEVDAPGIFGFFMGFLDSF